MAGMGGMPIYTASKSAMIGLTRSLARDYGQYNIRVNAISAGPLNTLAARGVSGFTTFRGHVETAAPLRRNIEQGDVGDAALFLSSNLARSITGEIMFVDAGYNIMGA